MKTLIFTILFFPGLCMAEAVIQAFSLTPDYSFDAWEGQFEVVEDGIKLTAPNTQGGFGFHGHWDLSALKDHVPHLRLRLENKGDLRTLQLRIFDVDRTRAGFRFRVRQLPGGIVHLVPAEDGQTLGDPAAIDQAGEDNALDLSSINHIQILGDWRADDVVLIFMELMAISGKGDQE